MKIFWTIAVVIFFLWLLGSYSSNSPSSAVQGDSYDDDVSYEEEDVVDEPEYETSDLEYNGYPCTEDCSGHEAGYDWAEENDIQDENDCGGNSNSFIEGCYSYVEENYSEDTYEEDE